MGEERRSVVVVAPVVPVVRRARRGDDVSLGTLHDVSLRLQGPEVAKTMKYLMKYDEIYQT